ncbi:MAG TPA: endolytic transglycosylase MltG, partial [Candidatus Nanoarchaeia archaeon]|nr:endolytic transglycosylase MltG [Candidatus Nanoarchaeia archaeon]
MSIRKKLPYLLIPVGLAVIVLLGYGWYRVDLLPTEVSDFNANFILPKGESPSTTAHRLEQAHLIKSSTAFLVYLTVHGLRGKVQSGDYALSTAYSTEEIIDVLTNGKVATKRLTVPEGTTVKKIEQLAVAKGIKQEDFEAALQGDYGKDFLVGRPPGVGLEGYLYPDSYDLPLNPDAKQLVGQMVDNFDKKVTPQLRTVYVAEGLTLHQAVTLASIVEKEVPSASDRQVVAGIFLKRLQLGMALESDVTVHYAADQLGVDFSTNLDSPYNTYKHAGLPP